MSHTYIVRTHGGAQISIEAGSGEEAITLRAESLHAAARARGRRVPATDEPVWAEHWQRCRCGRAPLPFEELYG